jgi:cytochrome c biogenesis factor
MCFFNVTFNIFMIRPKFPVPIFKKVISAQHQVQLSCTELNVYCLSQIVLQAVSANIAQVSYTVNVESTDRRTLTHMSKVNISLN